MFSQEMLDAGVNALPPLPPDLLAQAEDIVRGVYLAMKAEEFGRVMGVNPVPGGLMGVQRDDT